MCAAEPTPSPSIFTRLIIGEIPSHRVYEDEKVVAFLDVNPLSRGHLLVVPREEKSRIEDLSDESAAALGRVLPKLCRALARATESQSCNILINNGANAGQVVMHAHMHIIPKDSRGHGLRVEWRAGKLDASEGAALAASLKNALAADRGR